eukprot:scaffold55200_cov39-Prasinocladus_malaysianus.AAC.1
MYARIERASGPLAAQSIRKRGAADSAVRASLGTVAMPRYDFITQEEEQVRRLASEVCSVDCSHPTALTLTHHKGNNNPPGLDLADTSTGGALLPVRKCLVLHALKAAEGDEISHWVEKPYVSTNHFDIDALTS